jgi:hypothetical protein
MPTYKNEVSGPAEVAIVGISKRSHGVAGESQADGAGVVGVSAAGDGVSGYSQQGNGVVGESDAEAGVKGLSKSGRGVDARSETGEALRGISDSGNAVYAQSHSGVGVAAVSETASAVRAVSTSGRGVEGWSESSYGVSGDSSASAGVRGTSKSGRGVEGWSGRSEGVVGICETGTGVWGVAGRSPLVDKFKPGMGVDVSLAKKWADAARTVPPHRPPHPDPPPEHAGIATLPIHTLSGGVSAGDILPTPGVSLGDAVAIAFDDAAGVGVCGEHRGGGIGVRAVSRAGVGLDASSTDYEAIHAETHAPRVAAIAAYNANPAGTGAALYAKKVGSLGHAGFFDGRVWISGELGVGGDILLANADCAEDFDVVSLTLAEPGTVMVIGDDSVLTPCEAAYDKRVAGVISGAGEYKPGLVLDKQPALGNRSPVALMGKVCCKVTAANGAIDVGDLLTTSTLTGHAMKANDRDRAFGAVIGKALKPLSSGTGLIPILIALQ